MCQLKSLAITNEQCIAGFKATVLLCQVAAGKRVSTWLVAGNVRRGNGQRCTAPAHCADFYLHERHCSYNVRADRRISCKQIYILVNFEAIHCVKLISCK